MQENAKEHTTILISWIKEALICIWGKKRKERMTWISHGIRREAGLGSSHPFLTCIWYAISFLEIYLLASIRDCKACLTKELEHEF